MGILFKTVGIGLAVSGAKKIKHKIEEENQRKNTVCCFDKDISKEEFYVMVRRGGKGIWRIVDLYADGTMVYGIVQSKNGVSNWTFRLDFNDYGKLTGKYRIFADDKNSDIPKIIADRIARQIRSFPEMADSDFDEEVYNEEIREEIREQAEACCPYCGKENYDDEAKFCMHCGNRFRV